MEYYYSGNPNNDNDPSNPNYRDSAINMAPPSPSSQFLLSDYLLLDDDDDVGQNNESCWSQNTEASNEASHGFGGATNSNENNNIKCQNRSKRNKVDQVSQRVVFRTRSDLENMDDGYKWRKYGKKSVKNSPYLRNYYKCTSEGCSVKKRVERDRDDPSYVLTSYDGVHNHVCPSSFKIHSSNNHSSLHTSTTSSSNP